MPGFDYIRSNFPEPVRYGPPVFTSTEPTVDGYNTLPEETLPRNCLQIVAGDSRQLAVFQMIEHMPAQLLQPSGELYYDRRARGYPWVRRTDEGQRPKIMYLRNGPSVVFQVTFHTEETVKVHVPFESWDRSTGTAEDMRASLQQAYLNLCRGVVHYTVILKRGERPLPICQSAIIPGRARVVATTAHNRSHSHGYNNGYGHGPSSSLAVLPMPREATMASRHQHPLHVKDTFDLYNSKRGRRAEEYYDDISDRPLGYHLDQDTNLTIRRWRSTTNRREDVYRDRVVPQGAGGNGRHHFRHVSHEDVSSYGSGTDPSSASGSSTYYYYTSSPYYGSSGSERSNRAKRKTGWWSRLF